MALSLSDVAIFSAYIYTCVRLGNLRLVGKSLLIPWYFPTIGLAHMSFPIGGRKKLTIIFELVGHKTSSGEHRIRRKIFERVYVIIDF